MSIRDDIRRDRENLADFRHRIKLPSKPGIPRKVVGVAHNYYVGTHRATMECGHGWMFPAIYTYDGGPRYSVGDMIDCEECKEEE